MTNSASDGKKSTDGTSMPTPGTTNAQTPGTTNAVTPGTSATPTPSTAGLSTPTAAGASPVTPVRPATSAGIASGGASTGGAGSMSGSTGGMSGSSTDYGSSTGYGSTEEEKHENKLKARAKEEASKLADQARAAADDRVEDFKGEATHRISETADNIRSAGREFGADSYQAQAADYLADNLMQAADRIRAQDLDTIARDATDFARRNPAIVLGGAALLGFAAARLLKASERGDFS